MTETLPTLKFKGSNDEYFLDVNLRQLRNTKNPNDYINLSKDDTSALIYWAKNGGNTPFSIKDLPQVEKG